MNEWMNEWTNTHNDGNHDERSDDGDEDSGQLGQRAADIGDAVPLEPQRRQRLKKPEPKVAAVKKSRGNHETQIAKKAKCKQSDKTS